MPSDGGPGTAADPPINVPELRDYQRINAELVHRLNNGQRYVRLEGVERQRLLVCQVAGPWQAVVEIDGDAGPELAAEMDAPGLIVVCRGGSADGAGSRLAAGRLVLLQNSGTALGYFQRGGLIVAREDVGPRAGLNQKGGDLVLLGRSGGLTGERQTGGRLFLKAALSGPNLGRGSAGGRRIDLREDAAAPVDIVGEDRERLEEAMRLVDRFQPAS